MKLNITAYAYARPLKMPTPISFDTEAINPIGIFGLSHSEAVERTIGQKVMALINNPSVVSITIRKELKNAQESPKDMN
jgi:hypothetical protein